MAEDKDEAKGNAASEPVVPAVQASDDAQSIQDSQNDAIERVEAILEEMPPAQQEVIRQVFHQGPLPPATLLRDYDLVVPGLAREIADGAAEERTFRHDMTRRTGTQEFVLNLAGLGAILIALMMMLAIVAYMVAQGAPGAGAALGGAIIVGVIVAMSNYRKSEATKLPAPAPENPDKE